MANRKFSDEFKLKLVRAYLNGEGGYDFLTKKYNIKSDTSLRRWVNAYRQYGIEGVIRKSQHTSYSFEYKYKVVKAYLEGRHSIREIANIMKLREPSLISAWVSTYRKEGISGFQKTKGRSRSMTSKTQSSKTVRSKKSSIDNSDKQRIKELEKQLYYAQLEIDFLKELKRVQQEDEARMRRLRLSSVLSKKSTN